MAEYIEREALLEIIKKLAKEPRYYHDGEDFYGGICAVECELQMLPTADVVEVKHGEWIKSIHKETPIIKDGRLLEKEHEVFCCSVCGVKIVGLRNMSFCPFCGAKMDGERKCDK